MPIRLFKDFADGRVCFYWVDDEERQVSPAVATFLEAEEWWKRYLFAQYPGPERRQSILDRRTDQYKRRYINHQLNLPDDFSYGRRVTDQPVRVDHDLATAKIRLLKHMAQVVSGPSSSRH